MTFILIYGKINEIKLERILAMRFEKNQILKTEILETNMLGFGVCKIDGAVIFVQNAVAGDFAEIRIIKCAKNYYIARIENLMKASPYRAEPRCPVYKRCGGCNFQHIQYDHEKALKENFVRSCLKKEGLGEINVLPVLSTGCSSGYRNKGQFPVALDETGKVVCGFFSQKSHKVCPIDSCDIQDPAFASICAFVCEYLTEHKILPYQEEDHSGLVRHIYLRRAVKTGQIMLCLVLKEDAFPEEKNFADLISAKFPAIHSISFNIQPKPNNVILGKESKVIYGKEKICDTLCDRDLLISAHSFYQVNHDAAELLYYKAFQMAEISQFDCIVDLYCGIGSIGLATKTDKPIIGVEIVPEAVEDAKENACLNGVENATYICGDAKDAFTLIRELNFKKPLYIVDPPRKGLDPNLISDMAENGVKNILYISCSPETFARDLKLFSDFGYRFADIQPVDLFPRSGHVECIGYLEK